MLFVLLVAVAFANECADSDAATACGASDTCTYTPAADAKCENADFEASTDPCIGKAESVCTGDAACTYHTIQAVQPSTCAASPAFSPSTDPCIGKAESVCTGDAACTYHTIQGEQPSTCAANPSFEPPATPCNTHDSSGESTCTDDTTNGCDTYDASSGACTNSNLVMTDPCIAQAASQSGCEALASSDNCVFTAEVAEVPANCATTDGFTPDEDPCIAQAASQSGCEALASSDNCVFTAEVAEVPANCATTDGFTPVDEDPCIAQAASQSGCEALASSDNCVFTAAVLESCVDTAPSSSATVVELLFGALFAAVALLF